MNSCFFVGSSWLVLKLRVDDPLDAVAVHLCGGLWGVVATPLFAREDGIIYNGSKTAFMVREKPFLLFNFILGETSKLLFPYFSVSRVESCWCSCNYGMVSCPVHSHVWHLEWNENTESERRSGD